MREAMQGIIYGLIQVTYLYALVLQQFYGRAESM